jgi:hypothetical protein
VRRTLCDRSGAEGSEFPKQIARLICRLAFSSNA